MDAKNQMQVTSLGRKSLYLLNTHTVLPQRIFLFSIISTRDGTEPMALCLQDKNSSTEAKSASFYLIISYP